MDSQNMKAVLLDFPMQIKDAIKASRNLIIPEVLPAASLPDRWLRPTSLVGTGQVGSTLQNIIICGMGGSAISGDLLTQYLNYEIKIPILINRNYSLPNFVNQSSLVFISSYSGNTEETLSAYKQAIKRTKNVICITSGGKLANEKPACVFKIPKGYQPRCALGWLFVPMLLILNKLKIISNKQNELNETIELLSNLRDEFNKSESAPFLLAKKMLNKFPIIYSDLRFSPVAKRWVTQLNENSKIFAHFNTFSELNHNEIVGFPACQQARSKSLNNSLVTILIDREYDPQIKRRIEITVRIIAPYTEIEKVESQGNSLLARLFSLIYFGDWVSYWLAILRKVDPTPIERIEELKHKLEVGSKKHMGRR
ncbi:bifunctional phosphoglucose/phosphomannose isomerase [candidate division WOR-3 bacterium]|nr:bifunctional phosphoglucose/phosphomannose isomerase [candidate division WOR-3 bacterium]